MTQTRHSHDASTFVGREDDLVTLTALCSSARLVTVTGPAGVGKTRVGTELAGRLTQTGRAVDVIRLSSLTPDGSVAQRIADSVRIPANPQRPLVSALIERWSRSRRVLVLDNAEHVVDDVAGVVHALLEACPLLTIIVTSRRPLGFAGEHVYRLAPLATSLDDAAVGSVSELDAVRLFVDRAMAIDRTLTVGLPELDLIALVVKELDGLPLSIELAAVQLRSLTIRELAERLDSRMTVLSEGHRSPDRHHASLRSLVAWSIDDLEAVDRAVLELVSVFAGSFDAGMVQCVSAATPGFPHDLTLDVTRRTLSGLVDQSLLQRTRTGDSVRFHLLRTLREYTRIELDRRPWGAEVPPAYREAICAVAREARADWFGPRQVWWRDRLRAERPNLVDCLDELSDRPSHAGEALEAVSGLWFSWVSANLATRARTWIRRALSHVGPDHPAVADALWTDCWLAVLMDDREGATTRARELMDRAPAPTSAAGRDAREMSLAAGLWERPDAALRTALHRLVEERRAAGELNRLADDLFYLAVAQLLDDDLDLARSTADELAALCAGYGELWNRGYALWLGAVIEFSQGRHEGARDRALAGLDATRTLGEHGAAGICIDVLAWIAQEEGDHRRAALLIGCAEQIEVVTGHPLAYWDLGHHERCGARAREALGPVTYATLTREGAELDVGAAMDFAAGRALAGDGPELTARQWQIARLISRGRTNAQMAEELTLSVRTVEKHVENALLRLSLATRSQLAAWVVRHD
ncbi:MAG: LuxR C-terminal-related transcriptional regulator [Aeromicrobium sp.]